MFRFCLPPLHHQTQSDVYVHSLHATTAHWLPTFIRAAFSVHARVRSRTLTLRNRNRTTFTWDHPHFSKKKIGFARSAKPRSKSKVQMQGSSVRGHRFLRDTRVPPTAMPIIVVLVDEHVPHALVAIKRDVAPMIVLILPLARVRFRVREPRVCGVVVGLRLRIGYETAFLVLVFEHLAG